MLAEVREALEYLGRHVIGRSRVLRPVAHVHAAGIEATTSVALRLTFGQFQ
jgi:hypothetical protein